MLSEELVKRGHFVSVISALPHYPSGMISKEFLGIGRSTRIENGVQIIRVKIPSLNRANIILRLIQFFIFQIRAAAVLRKHEYDIALFSNPCFSTGIPLFYSHFVKKKPYIYSIHDVYPNVGVKLKIFRHWFVIKMITLGESYCLRHAKFVRILSESFEKSLEIYNIPKERLVLIYDWVDTSSIKPISRNNEFSSKYDLIDKFVILYAGNIGFSQGLDALLKVAEEFIHDNSIQFVFVGDGAGKDSLLQEFAKLDLVNVQFIPFQPRTLLPLVLASADISIVILRKGLATQSFPSKIFSILASGRPILACLDKNSDCYNLINRSKSGICVEPGDTQKIREEIINLKAHKAKRLELAKNGRKYVVNNHSVESATDSFEKIFELAIRQNR